MTDPMDLSWLRGPAHNCNGTCSHGSGILKDEGPPVATPHPERSAAPERTAGSAPTLDPEAICEDCSCPLKDHSGSKGNCVYCACKSFVPIGPKQ